MKYLEYVFFNFANSTGPDEMPHHHGRHCLPKYLFAGIKNEKSLDDDLRHDCHIGHHTIYVL